MKKSIIDKNDTILVTGGTGFIGTQVVKLLAQNRFLNIRCLVRPTSNVKKLKKIITNFSNINLEIIEGNLLSVKDCENVSNNASVIIHLAAGRGVKHYSDAFLNTVVTTKNLLNANKKNMKLKRFLCVSSFTVYALENLKRGTIIDEDTPIENKPYLRYEPYCYAKVKQENFVRKYCTKNNMPFVIVRPGVVYGNGNDKISGRVGIDTFGIFLHLGGHNILPLTFVENCASAIVLASILEGADGEIFNIIDDDLPTSAEFLQAYKKYVKSFYSIYLPHPVSFLLCMLWEKYAEWSANQLPPVFNRKKWINYWKGHCYSNMKIKNKLGWKMNNCTKNFWLEYLKSYKDNTC